MARASDSGARRGVCPVCGEDDSRPIFQLRSVPARTSLLYENVERSKQAPRGDIYLNACKTCCFIWNSAFMPEIVRYSEYTEETQIFSPYYRRHMKAEIRNLVENDGVRGMRVLEIGCGKGEFLAELCRFGGNVGIGFDPAFRPDRHPCPDNKNVSYYNSLFEFRSLGNNFDLIVFRMTLEHIADPYVFLWDVVEFARANGNSAIYGTVPNAAHIFSQNHLCDILYEHCSYFTRESLAFLLWRVGYAADRISTNFGAQHLEFLARPGPQAEVGPVEGLDLSRFRRAAREMIQNWVANLSRWAAAGETTAVWGSGSKATAFLNAISNPGDICAVIDINPYRYGSYVAGVGLPVVAPRWLHDNPVDRVIAMNPIYLAEIARKIAEMGSAADLLSLHQLGAAPDLDRR